jgi:AraC-like DNA-binding protein
MIYFDRNNILSETGQFSVALLKVEEGVSFYEVKTERLNIEIKEIILDDYCICEVALHVHKPTAITTAFRRGISLTLSLKNQVEYSIYGIKDGKLLRHHFNIAYTPDFAGQYHFRVPGFYKFFCVLFDFQYFKKWKETHIFLQEFLREVEARKPITISDTQLLATGQMTFLVDELFAPGIRFPEMHRHATILELLRLSIFQRTAQKVMRKQPDLSEAIKIHTAKEYITNHLDAPCTVPELALVVSLNRYKLARGFKEIFKKPISIFLLEERMARAKHLLQESDLAIEEVGQSVGYVPISNFSTAFKKYFKISPSECRKKIQPLSRR